MYFKEETLDSETIYDGAILKLRRDKVTVKNGTSYREIIEHSGGSVVAAFTGDNKIVMVRQYRKAVEEPILEAPAGKLNPDEDPLEAARRELEEETGYYARKIEHMTSIYPSVGYTDEKLHIYIAWDLEKHEPHPDENEELEIIEMDFDKLYEETLAGNIEDGKTVIAVLMSKEWQRRGLGKGEK